MKREQLADLILERIKKDEIHLQKMYRVSENQIGYFYIDNLLPEDIAEKIYTSFPSPKIMKLRKNLREFKYTSAQMDKYDPILEESIYAFQDSRVVNQIKHICSIDSLYPDEYLYAGGISLMSKGQYLNPHLDNSHDIDRKRWRVLNLLYYTSPEWKHDYGGNLEIWTNGVKSNQITIDSNFNRLAVIATHGNSWHSVSPISRNSFRTCVSNYYFSDSPLKLKDKFHITSFRGRPEEKIRDIILKVDIKMRQALRKLFPKGIDKTEHIYKKNDLTK